MDDADRQGEFTDRVLELVKLVRLIRQRRLHAAGAPPAGMLGILTLIDEIGRDGPGCHAKELARRTGLDPSTVSRAVTGLVGQGLVRRGPDPTDGRASVLTLTDDGRRALRDARLWFDNVLRRALDAWRPEDLAALTDALGRFIADVERALDTTRTHRSLEAAR